MPGERIVDIEAPIGCTYMARLCFQHRHSLKISLTVRTLSSLY